MNTATETTAFRIWQYAAPREWNCPLSEVAEALHLPLGTARNVVRYKGWHNRFAAAERAGRTQLAATEARAALGLRHV